MKKFIKENYIFILAIILIILLRLFVITPVKVDGTSMNNTLYENDILILNKVASYDRGSIVVVSKNVEGSRLIKRVIALPGESIECKDGIIYINDRAYEDKFAFNKTKDFEKVVLKENEYFLMGDNRLVSEDSRVLGPINKKDIMGVCHIRLYPFNKIGNI